MNVLVSCVQQRQGEPALEPDMLWARMLSYRQAGYLLGAAISDGDKEVHTLFGMMVTLRACIALLVIPPHPLSAHPSTHHPPITLCPLPLPLSPI